MVIIPLLSLIVPLASLAARVGLGAVAPKSPLFHYKRDEPPNILELGEFNHFKTKTSNKINRLSLVRVMLFPFIAALLIIPAQV